jgi:hypothetical protein
MPFDSAQDSEFNNAGEELLSNPLKQTSPPGYSGGPGAYIFDIYLLIHCINCFR